MASRKGIGFEVELGKTGLGGLVAFIVGVGIPLALSAYVFYTQIITLELLADLKDDKDYQSEEDQSELTQLYAGSIIILVMTGMVLLGGSYAIGAGLVALASGSLFLSVK